MKEIVIVGGGTAGWMAAISLSSQFPDKTITVIDPTGIPPVGVGESVTGVIMQFVSDPAHGLDFSEFFRRADTTLKLGIRFVNWQGLGTEYLAPIDSPAGQFPHPSYEDLEAYYALLRNEGISIGEAQLHGRLMPVGKTDFIREDGGSITGKYSAASCHFDALKFAAWLKEIAPQRANVRHVDATVSGFEQDAGTGFVRKVVTGEGEEIGGDFFLDCSGFGRQVFAKAYSPKWLDFSDHIRVDRAIPAFGERGTAEIPVYTQATAMRNGWAWQIPVGGRIGHGYLYSSRYTDDATAAAEFREAAGVDLGDTPRIISFEPGKFATQWEGNVCAIGLAGGFLEALESTTIHIMYAQIKAMTDLFLPYYTAAAAAALSRRYNAMMQLMYEDMMDFVSFHYHAGREDTEFWRDYQKPEAITPGNLERMEKWAHAFPVREDFNGLQTTRFTLTAGLVVWMPMLCGLGFAKKEAAEILLRHSKLLRQARGNRGHYEKFCEFICGRALTQREAIAHLRGDAPEDATGSSADPGPRRERPGCCG